MATIIITVNGGGFLCPESRTAKHIELATQIKTDQGLRYFRASHSTLKGLYCYLLGETRNVNECLKHQEILNALITKSVIRITRPFNVTSFFSRRPINDQALEKKINLNQYTFKQAAPTIQLLADALRSIYESSNLRVINEKLIADNKQIDMFPGEKWNAVKPFISNQKVINGIETAIARQKLGANKILTEIIRQIECDSNFRKKIDQASSMVLSVLTSPKETRHWVNSQFHRQPMGKPIKLMTFDFKIYLKALPSEIEEKLLNGPGIGSWGEGGMASVEWLEDNIEIPANSEIDLRVESHYLVKQMLFTYKDLGIENDKNVSK